MNPKALLAALLVLALVPAVTATSFIQDCQYDEYRTNNSDAVFTGTVTGTEEVRIDGLFGDAYTHISFAVVNTTKGNVSDEFVLTQPGHISGKEMIPAITLEWADRATYRIQARESEAGYQLVCGVMGRELIRLPKCEPVKVHAKDPETGDVVMYYGECEVPQGWQIVDAPQPVIEEPPQPKATLWQRITNWLNSWF